MDTQPPVFPISSIFSTTTTAIIAAAEDGFPVFTSSPSSHAHVHSASGVSPPTTPRNSSSLEIARVNLSTAGLSIPEPPPLRRKPSRFALLVQGLKNNGNETLVNEPRLKTSKSAVSLRSLFASQSTQRSREGSSTSELQPPRQKLSSRLPHVLKASGNGTDLNEQRLRMSKSALSLRTLFTAQSAQRRRRGSHGGAIEIPQRDNDDYHSIKPHIPGVFTPNLPPELWSLIFQYSMNAPFPTPTSRSNSNLPHSPYPYSTVISPSHSTSQDGAEYPRPVSFLAQAPPHDHLSERLYEYTRLLHWKASLTRVCRLWNVVGQQPLYEFVWIAKAREGRALAERLGGDGMMTLPPINISCSVTTVPRVNQRKAKRAMALGWIKSVLGSDSRVAPPTALPTIKSPRASRSSISSTRVNAGRHIRRLHIETPALDKCSPHDLLLILQHCPNLETFSDYRSVRRPMHPLALSLSPVVPFSHASSSLSRIVNNSHSTPWSSHTLSGQAHPARQTLLTPDALLHTLLSRPLKKLSWTNYEYEGGANFSRGVRFYEEVVGPRLAGVGANLEYLEMAMSCGADSGRRDVGGMWSVGGVGLCEGSSGALMHEQEERWKQERMQEMMERRLDALLSGYEDAVGSIPQAPERQAFEAGILTRLEVTGATTTTYVSPRDPSSTLTTTSPTVGIDGFEYTLALPALRSLKVALDNATFFVLSSWDMPLLTHLSVMSADFAYAGGGFRKFFEVHGCKLFQLELGHSSGDIEEAWLTEAPGHWEGAAGSGSSSYRIPLEAWCPNLKQFICSADAEWDWQTPDWIAPHVLLPAHSGVEFIGVRDMERRLVGDAEQFVRRIRGEGAATTGAQGGGGDADDPYFMLLEQFGSLLRPEAFPSLMVVRDMSWESSMVRRTGRLGLGSAGRALPSSSPRGPYPYESGSSEYPYMDSTVPTAARSRKLLSKASLAHLSSRRPQDSQSFSAGWKVQRFWNSIAEKCAARAVVLQDCHGEPIRGGGDIAF